MKTFFSFIVVFFSFGIAIAQFTPTLINKIKNNKQDNENFIRAESLFQDENYLDAIPYYQVLEKNCPDEGFIKYRLGICFLYRNDMPEKSLEYIQKASKLNFSSPDFPFYLGRAYHLNYLFDEARMEFQTCVDSKIIDKKLQSKAKLYIDYCRNAKEHSALPVSVEIKNIGKEINTAGGEYVPVISSDEAFLIFTYRGLRSTGGLQSVYTKNTAVPDSSKQYYEDIFYSYKIGNRWITPDPIGGNINTPFHDAASALSADGQKLFIFKSTPKDNGDIYMSHLEGSDWSVPAPLGKNINTKEWEGSCSLSADEKTLYFSSERSGGYGGKDIWKSELQKDGSWGKAINTGSSINTPNDEDAPFIHPDGKMLHFSSNGHQSMGGYDIFKSYLQKDGTWSKPQNLGFPINTVNDDIYYVVTADGNHGYYSSARPGGYGMQDIYVVKPGIMGKQNALVAIKGTVTLDDSPVKAYITVINADTEVELAKHTSNSSTGKYLVNLPSGANYKVYYKAEGSNEEQIKSFNMVNVDYYLEASIDVQFYTSDLLAKRAKNKLHILNKDGSIYKTATQTRDGRFFYNYLPPDEEVLFKLEGEDVEFINRLVISVCGINKTLVKGKDGFFRFEYLVPEAFLLTPISEKDLALAKKNPAFMTYSEIVEQFGKYKAQEMSFTVQVGAYYEAHNFNYSHLESLGKLETRNYNDGITRFTIGEFSSLAEAEETRKKIVNLGGETTDSFVLAIYKGKRIFLKDLATNNFYNSK